MDIIRIKLEEQFARRADGRDAFTGTPAKRGRTPEQIEPPVHRLIDQGHEDLFLARKVLVDRPLRVFEGLGDSIHAQAVIPIWTIIERATSRIRPSRSSISRCFRDSVPFML